MEKIINGILIVVFMFIGTLFMSFVFSNERPKRDKEFYKQLDEKDSSDNT